MRLSRVLYSLVAILQLQKHEGKMVFLDKEQHFRSHRPPPWSMHHIKVLPMYPEQSATYVPVRLQFAVATIERLP